MIQRAKHGCSILLVEDDSGSLRGMEKLLLQNGFTVRTAGTCAEAVRQAGEQRFDLLIADLGLPDGDGRQLLRKLKEKSPMIGIAISGYNAPDDIDASEKAGFARHLSKPLDFGLLEETIKQVCPQG